LCTYAFPRTSCHAHTRNAFCTPQFVHTQCSTGAHTTARLMCTRAAYSLPFLKLQASILAWDMLVYSFGGSSGCPPWQPNSERVTSDNIATMDKPHLMKRVSGITPLTAGTSGGRRAFYAHIASYVCMPPWLSHIHAMQAVLTTLGQNIVPRTIRCLGRDTNHTNGQHTLMHSGDYTSPEASDSCRYYQSRQLHQARC
jgi:hypothetical protein